MNKLIIPPSANWYESFALACAPDNTVIYGSRNEIVVIHPKPPEEPADVKLIAGIHSQRIVGVVVNPSWGNPDKLAVSVAEDNVVRLLDIQTCTSKLAHVGHTTRSDKVIGATFAGSDKVVSVSEDGFIIIWRLGANHLTSIADVLGSKAKVSCISSCPHAPWLIAFGLKKGTIIITDLRKTGKVLYRLVGHDGSINSLSWCPAPFNVFPKRVKKTKEIKKDINEDKTEADSKSIDNVDGAGVSNAGNSTSAPTESTGLGTDVSQECAGASTAEDSTAAPPESKVLDTDISLPVSDPLRELGGNESSTADLHQIENKDEESVVVENEGTLSPQVSSDEHCEQKSPIETDLQNLLATAKDCAIFIDIVVKPELIEDATQEQTKEVIQNESQEENQESEQASDKTQDINVESKGSALEIKASSAEEQSSVQGEVKNEEFPDPSPDIEASNKEFLLASTARGGSSVKIWRAGTDGLLQTELYLPGKPRSTHSHRNDDKSWIAICWVTPKDLLSSSHKGELLHWKFPFEMGADGKLNRWRLIHGDHHRHIFCIAAPTKLYDSLNDEEWKDRSPLNAWTMGKDRFILNTSLTADHKTLTSYPTMGGIITCMSTSPIDPTRIAMATGDGTCRTWDLSRPHLQHIVMTQMSDRSQIKITSLAWHPSKEICLAFGTFDGRVGLMDTNHTSKGTKFLVQSFHGSVYKVEWGPLNGNCETLGLYAVASGNLMAYDIDKPLHEPVKFNVEVNCVTHFAWKPDYSILAVGTKTGDVMLYSTKLKLLTTLLLQTKGVRWLTWHPEGTPENCWLAVSTNNVIIYDCSSINENSVKQKRSYEECTVAMFTEHTHHVQCLAWSPHEGGMLASTSEDGTALVWNVKTKTLLHSCISPNLDMLNTVVWSPLDPDYLITGGRDCMIQIWKLSENPPKPKIEKKQKQKLLKLEEAVSDTADVQKAGASSKKPIRKYLLAGIAQTQNPNFQSALLGDCERLFALVYGKTENKCHNGHTEEEQTKFDALQLFGGKEEIEKLLVLEKTSHQNKALHSESISLWQGDIGDTIKKAIASGSLNVWLVGIAPMISFNLWQEACEAYANQLLEAANSRPVEAACFFLACHKVEEAIQTLCNASYFREALILAKCRLQPNDPVINNILERWAKFNIMVGNFEVAAQCYIALQQLEEAIKILFRRTDVPTLKFCVKLAKHCDNKDLLEAVEFRLRAFDCSELADEPVEQQCELVSRVELELMRSSEQNLDKLGENGHDMKGAGGDTVPTSSGGDQDVDNKSYETGSKDGEVTGDGQTSVAGLVGTSNGQNVDNNTSKISNDEKDSCLND